jgi:hypothetical protein
MFIEINGRILNKREYQRRIILIKRLLEADFAEAAKNTGLERRGRHFLDRETGLKAELVFEEEKWREV